MKMPSGQEGTTSKAPLLYPTEAEGAAPAGHDDAALYERMLDPRTPYVRLPAQLDNSIWQLPHSRAELILLHRVITSLFDQDNRSYRSRSGATRDEGALSVRLSYGALRKLEGSGAAKETLAAFVNKVAPLYLAVTPARGSTPTTFRFDGESARRMIEGAPDGGHPGNGRAAPLVLAGRTRETPSCPSSPGQDHSRPLVLASRTRETRERRLGRVKQASKEYCLTEHGESAHQQSNRHGHAEATQGLNYSNDLPARDPLTVNTPISNPLVESIRKLEATFGHDVMNRGWVLTYGGAPASRASTRPKPMTLNKSEGRRMIESEHAVVNQSEARDEAVWDNPAPEAAESLMAALRRATEETTAHAAMPISTRRLIERIEARDFDGVPGKRPDGIRLMNLQPYLEPLAAAGDVDALTAIAARLDNLEAAA